MLPHPTTAGAQTLNSHFAVTHERRVAIAHSFAMLLVRNEGGDGISPSSPDEHVPLLNRHGAALGLTVTFTVRMSARQTPWLMLTLV